MQLKRWSKKEDEKVVEIVLKCLEAGISQKQALEMAAEAVGRPVVSTTNRWYLHLRKQHEADVAIALQNGKQARKRDANAGRRAHKPSQRAISQIRSALDQLEEQYQALIDRNAFLEKRVQELEEVVEVLREKNRELAKERDQWKEKWESIDPKKRIIEEDYRLILQILNRAREQALLEDEQKMLSRIQNGAPHAKSQTPAAD